MSEPGVESPGSPDEPPRKRVRAGPRKVTLLFKAPGQKSCEVWLHDFCLFSSEFFEAKFDRWTSGDEPVEPIVLELPLECKPEKGAHVFRKRLLAAEIDEEIHWDPVKWWRASDGDQDAFFTALCIFDLVLMEKYCKEVVETLHTFKVLCPIGLGSLAKKFNPKVLVDKEVAVAEPSGPMVPMSPSTFEKLLDAVREEKETLEGVRPFLDRTLNLCSLSDLPDYVEELVAVCIFGDKKSELYSWVWNRLRRFLHRYPKLCLRLAEVLLSLPEIFPHDVMDGHVEKRLALVATKTLDILLIESGRRHLDAGRHRAVLDAIDLLVRLVSQDFDRDKDLGPFWQGVSDKLKSSISWQVFAIASSPAQRLCLLALGKHVGEIIRGYAHFVHQDQRGLLSKYILDLSPLDRRFLAGIPVPPLPQCDEHERSS